MGRGIDFLVVVKSLVKYRDEPFIGNRGEHHK